MEASPSSVRTEELLKTTNRLSERTERLYDSTEMLRTRALSLESSTKRLREKTARLASEIAPAQPESGASDAAATTDEEES